MKFNRNTSTGKRLQSPLEQAKTSILSKRLKTTEPEALRLIDSVHLEVSKILQIPDSSIKIDTEFTGPSFDLVFSINKQNKPAKKQQ